MSAASPVDRVLHLAAIPALAELHPADRASLVDRAHSWPEGERAREACELHLLLSGRVEVGVSQQPVEGPALVAAAETLTDGATRVTLVGDAAEIVRVERADLLWVMEDVFEVWLAMMRHVASRWIAVECDEDEGCATAEPPPTPGTDCLVQRIALLRRCRLFAGLRVHALGRLARRMEEDRVSAGSVLWERDAPARDAALVLAGGFESRGAGADAPGTPALGTFLGLRSALAGCGRLAEVVATRESRVLRLDTEALIDELEDDPETAAHFLRALAERALASPVSAPAGKERA